jgi:multiple sugar transport system ATP-binding protein
MAQIVLDHIDKVYAGGVKAIDGLSLEVKDGEFMVLVGPSGCGKSTALRSIAGLEEISSGTITIGDRVVNDLPPKDRDIAMVFQNYALYPHMTVEQNLAFGLQLRKTPKEEIKRRVNEAAKMLGLDQYLKRKPAALSGGQRQRVAMGRAIVREPQAFLMDEPLSNLDAKLRVSMRASLNQLHERLGVTTIYVTHDQVEAMTLGHRVCVMRDGRLQQVDTPQRLFESPVNLFVAGFIGSPAMNFVTAELTRDEGPVVTFAGFKLPVPLSVIDSKPGLDGYIGRKIILGIRPSDFDDAALADADWARIQVTAGVTEEVGSEIHVIFTIDAPPVEHASITDGRPGTAAKTRASRPWSAASHCGPPGCPPGPRSGPTIRSSSRSTPTTSSSSTPTAGCPSATRKRTRPPRSPWLCRPWGDDPPGTPRCASRPRGGTSPTHRPLTGLKARFVRPVTIASQ